MTCHALPFIRGLSTIVCRIIVIVNLEDVLFSIVCISHDLKFVCIEVLAMKRGIVMPYIHVSNKGDQNYSKLSVRPLC